MARSRNVKPGFFTNDDLVDLPFEVRLLFIGLWTIADKKGRLHDRPKKIKMEIFPADNVDCDAAISKLCDKGFLVRYTVNSANYIQIINWHKHQNPHMKEQDSSIPENPVQDPENPVQARLIPDSLNLIPDSLNPIHIPNKTETVSGKPDLSPLREKNRLIKGEAIEALRFLNEKTGKAYREVETNLKLIESILKSGVSLEDIRTVTMRKVRDWRDNPKMAEYLRPSTLYRRSNFEQYLGQTILPEEPNG